MNSVFRKFAACCSSSARYGSDGSITLCEMRPPVETSTTRILPRVERHEVEVLEGRIRRAGNREADLMRRSGDFLRGVRQHVLEGARAAQPFFDLRGQPGRPALREDPVDVAAIAEVGGNAAGGCVRLPHVAQFLESRHDVAQRGGRHPEPAAGQPQRGNRFPLLDIGLDQRSEDSPIPFGKFRMLRHGCLAVTRDDC